MTARWNAKTICKNILTSIDGDYTPEASFNRPIRNLEHAISTGVPEIATEFDLISSWYSDNGVVKLFSDVNSAVQLLYQSVHFAAADIAFWSHRWEALNGNSGQISDNEACLNLARSISLGCDGGTGRIALELFRNPGVIYSSRREHSVLPQYVFNLYSRWSRVRMPSRIARIPVRGPYGRLLELWNTRNADALHDPIVAVCEFHVAQSRYMNNTETPEFWLLSFELQPVEILALFRIREALGLMNPYVDHPILNTPAGRLYPPMHVDPDPIIVPALKAAFAQIEQEKKKRSRL